MANAQFPESPAESGTDNGPCTSGSPQQQQTATTNNTTTTTTTTTNTSTSASASAGGGPGLIHGLIGLSSGGFSETFRNSIQDSILRTVGGTKDGDVDANASTSIELVKTKTGNGSMPEKEDEEEEAEKLKIATEGLRKPKVRPPHHLLDLPLEILLLIIKSTPLADLMRLRRTCKTLRSIASPSQIRLLLGPDTLRRELLTHCKTCLKHDPLGRSLLFSAQPDRGFPFSNQCVDCALRANDSRIKVGRKVNLVDNDAVWVCRWCGYPISQSVAFGHDQFHRGCYKRYNDALFFFFCLGWLQLSLGVVAPALAWRYFRRVVGVFAPTVTSFLLLWICLGFLVFRGNRRRTYHYTFFLELAILGLWVPPVYYIVERIMQNPESPVPKSTQASLALFGLNIIFRLLNLLGNIILLFKPDLTRRHRPDVSVFKKAWYKIACFLVFWTYPQSLEQKYPPDYL